MSSTDGAGIVMPKTRQPAKAVCQVITALKNSKNVDGPTMTEIVKFINGALHKPATKRQILTALRRGVEFGIIKRNKGHYMISSPEDTEEFTKLQGSLSRKGKVTRFRDQPKLVDKVMKRTPMVTKSRRGRPNRNSRSEFRVQSVESSTAVYDQDRDLQYV